MPSSASGRRRCSRRSPSICSRAATSRRSCRGSAVRRPRCSASNVRRSSSVARRAPETEMRRIRSRSTGGSSARSSRRSAPIRTWPSAAGSCRRSPRCSPSRSTGAGSSRRPSRPRRCGGATSSRPRCIRAVSHDLRSPLTGITTAIGALRNDTLVFSDDDRRELLETIAVDADRLNRLVGDLLDLSRLEVGGAEPASEVWALDDLVRQATDGPAEAPIGSTLQGESPLVHVDAVQIQRVLANLIENALKFSPPDLPRPRADHGDAPGGDRADRRPGAGRARPEEFERVFEPFYRRPERRARAPGSGSRSPAASRRRTAGASGSSRGRGRARRSRSHCPSSQVPAELSV